MYLTGEINRDPSASQLDPDIVAFALSGDSVEPIAHSLFRDAWTVRRSNFPAALALGVTSLEVGLKSCIASLVPNSRYLVTESPSPPIYKLLKEYLPTLQSCEGRSIPTLSESMLRTIQNMIHQRNLLVHQGRMSVDRFKIEEYLGLVRDLLFFFDFLSGETWALGLTGPTFREWLREQDVEVLWSDPLEEV